VTKPRRSRPASRGTHAAHDEDHACCDARRESADDTTGTARWLADYTFTQTGKPDHNDVRARFRFADGLIAEHDDSFGFHAWARQALGPPGLLLGWTPIIQGPVRRRARAGLDEFMAAGT